MNPLPPFVDALTSFKGFLRTQGVSDDIRWIWRNSVISRRCPGSRKSANRPIYIDSTHLAAESDIEAYYGIGVDRDLGIALSVFCVAEGLPYCYVYIPEDETDASYRMMSSLKCSIPEPIPTATLIRSPLLTRIFRYFLPAPANAWTINDIPLRPSN